MKKWKYVGKRRFVAGRWSYPGLIIENPTKPPGDWIEIKENNEISPAEELREDLLTKKMSELREIGDKYGAKDTKKTELIDEIIKAKIKRGEL